MKKSIISVVCLAVGMLAPHIVEAQGSMTYLSNLGNASSGSEAAGSDSWLAAQFTTGYNPGGYVLNSVQLAIAGSSGTPDDFSVMLYSDIASGTSYPGVSLGTLSGSMDPATAGTYTYTAPPGLTLSESGVYYIVVTDGTPLADGAFDWSVTSSPSGNNVLGWSNGLILFESSNGSDANNGSGWNVVSGVYAQFSLDATPAPEPGVLSLFGLGGLFLVRNRWKSKSIL